VPPPTITILFKFSLGAIKRNNPFTVFECKRHYRLLAQLRIILTQYSNIIFFFEFDIRQNQRSRSKIERLHWY
jgi:hypothetical protein